MTLADLIAKAKDCGNLFNSWSVPLMKDGKEVSFDIVPGGGNDTGVYVEIVNLIVNEDEKYESKKRQHRKA